MKAKEKAEELLLKYLKMPRHKMFNGWWNKIISKQCALIAVDECIKHEKQIVEQIKSLQLSNSFIAIINEGSFWTQVKHEIENI
jgi:hypothetical protein